MKELQKYNVAFKEDIRKDIQNIYKDSTDNQATLRDDIESVTDDFSSLSESLDMLKLDGVGPVDNRPSTD